MWLTNKKSSASLLFFLFFLSSFFVTQIQAGLLLEPYVGVIPSGTLKDSGVSYSHKNVVTSVGGRFGYTNLGLSTGLDYQIASGLKFDQFTPSYDLNELGFFLGMDLPVLLRGYGEYIMSSTIKATDSKFNQGTGYKLGVGFTGFPIISINLEMRRVSYDKYDNGISNVKTDTSDQSYLLSVSLPFKI